ncbi:MAG: MOSC domain-containing protein [Anaerolineae bacterium]
MFVDGEGMFQTARENARLLLIHPSLTDDTLILNAPEMPEISVPLVTKRPEKRVVSIWRDACEAWDEGDEVSEWASEFLGASVRLVRMCDDFRRVVDPKYSPRPSQTGFSDGFPLLVITEESVEDLNQRLVARGKNPVMMNRFRPNIVIQGGEPFAEDTWSTIQLGDVIIDLVKPCARCVIPTLDPNTGKAPQVGEPSATLATFRRFDNKIMFAQNGIHRAPGVLKVGQAVKIHGYRKLMA